MARKIFFCLLGLLIAILLIRTLFWPETTKRHAGDETRRTESEKSSEENSAGAIVRPIGSEIPFEDEILEIAKHYQSYGRVDDEARWAPYLCRMPMPSVPRFSQSDDPETHGEKLYYVYARNRYAYLQVANTPSPAGQVVIKESWKPKETTQQLSDRMWKDTKYEQVKGFPTKADKFSKPTSSVALGGGARYPFAKKDGKLFTAHQQAGLYIMFKPDDQGDQAPSWVYGTVTADGKTVTAGGQIESCIQCHQEAPYDGLFGLGKSTFGFPH